MEDNGRNSVYEVNTVIVEQRVFHRRPRLQTPAAENPPVSQVNAQTTPVISNLSHCPPIEI
jgi:hypothetical protein